MSNMLQRRTMALERTLKLLTNGSSKDPDAQWKAAIELGAITSLNDKSRAARALREVLAAGQAHALTRAHAVESLGRLGLRSSIPPLIESLTDSYRLVRSYAVAALGAIGDRRAVEPLLAALRHDDFFGVRAEAVKTLADLTACGRDPALRRRVFKEITRARLKEESKNLKGRERVLAELDRAAARLGPRATTRQHGQTRRADRRPS
jgi:HEAT repeat protein